MLQTMMQLPTRSRRTSYSISFQPSSEVSTRRLVDQRGLEPGLQGGAQLGLVVHHAAAGAAQRVGRPHHQRVARLAREVDAVIGVGDDPRGGHRLADLQHPGLEQLAVFGHLDGLERRAQQLDAVLREHAGLGQLDRQVEPGLAAQGRQQRVGPLALDDPLDRGHRQRLQVDRVRDLGVGHDRGRVRVDEDDPQAFLAQRAARLDPGVVELGGLPDDDRARADHHDGTPGHPAQDTPSGTGVLGARGRGSLGTARTARPWTAASRLRPRGCGP